jgi:type II secretory pathway pseudopilin PulG
MTTIILTIIGILLAAAAALMVIFYGGDAFNAGSIGAQANTYQNAGTNVISAVQLAKADNTAYTNLTSLSPRYLAEVPALPATSTPVLTGDLFTATVVSSSAANASAVCDRINTNLRNGIGAGVSVADVAAVAARTEKMGCVVVGNTDGVPTFFANA